MNENLEAFLAGLPIAIAIGLVVLLLAMAPLVLGIVLICACFILCSYALGVLVIDTSWYKKWRNKL